MTEYENHDDGYNVQGGISGKSNYQQEVDEMVKEVLEEAPELE